MLNSFATIEGYVEIIRDTIVKKSNKDYSHSFNHMMETQLKTDVATIEKILASIDIIGDTFEALRFFDEVGLGESTGNKYLNLYGVLNAIYLNSDAVLLLAQSFKIDNYNTEKDKIKDIKILHIRHKLGAHSVSYQEDNLIQCYTPVRCEMDNDKITFMNMNPEKNDFESIDLSLEINRYIQAIEIIMEKTVKKFIATVFKNNKDQLLKMYSEMDKLQHEAKR